MLTFKECTLAKLDKTFGLEQIKQNQAMQEWLDGKADISKREQENLLDLRYLLRENADNWNEQELALHFIGPMFTFVNFSSRKFNLFAERYLSGIVKGVEMGGKPDGIIAAGYREPETPYFCFQEYKKEKDAEGDPAAQVLAAMLVAQQINESENGALDAGESEYSTNNFNSQLQCVYGAYVRGRFWFFAVLSASQYCFSDAFVATRDDIFDIFRILKVLKRIIIRLCGEP